MELKKIQSEAVMVISKFQGGVKLHDSSQIGRGGFSIQISTAGEYENFGQTKIVPDKHILELEMTYTQFAELITSVGYGAGVPVTLRSLRHYDVQPLVDKKDKIDEVIDYTVESQLDEIDALIQMAENLVDKPNKTNKEALSSKIRNIKSNLDFYKKRVVEVAEKEKVKIKSEIENSAIARFAEIGQVAVGKAMLEQGINLIDSDKSCDNCGSVLLSGGCMANNEYNETFPESKICKFWYTNKIWG